MPSRRARILILQPMYSEELGRISSGGEQQWPFIHGLTVHGFSYPRSTTVLNFPNHQHHVLLTSNQGHCHGSVIQGHPEQMILL